MNHSRRTRHGCNARATVAFAFLFIFATAAHADFDYMDFTSPAGINLVGDAEVVGPVIRLTEFEGQEVGPSGWLSSKTSA